MLSLIDFIAEFFAQLLGPWGIGGAPQRRKTPAIFFYNTLSRSLEKFEPLRAGHVKMYNCGPTVYSEQHIGNLSMYVFTDILRRTLEFNGYKVQQVINITDVGHLVSDGDDGEDKMTKGLKRERKALTLENMRALAEKYAEMFFLDLATLNINTDGTRFPRASDHIPAQIAMVRTLEEKGYAYVGRSGVYFDTSRFPEYGKLGNITLEGLREGARVEVSDEKRNSTDFLLWKFDAKLGWQSPWGLGFPGWHIECSAMIREILGDRIDIHTGGIEHIPVHHNNEIAQSEAATGKKPFARFWLHRAHLQINGGKIAKSGGTAVYLSEILRKGFHPMALRYLLLGAHYRSPSNFSWEALEAAQTAYLKLRKLVDELPKDGGTFPTPYRARFLEAIHDDLNTPMALAVLWEMVSDKNVDPANLHVGIVNADAILGLNLSQRDEKAIELYRRELGQAVSMANIPDRVKELVTARELARAEKRWDDADEARKRIEAEGYVIEDTAHGPRLVAKY